MLLILLKSAACLAILMVFYKLFLEQLSIHNFKRFYLLGALLVSAIIPFITFIKYVEPTFDVPYFNVDHSVPLDLLPLEEPIVQEPINYLPIILWSFYGLGVLLFGAKFCLNLFGIVLRINKNEKQKHGNFISVLLNDFIVPHTFFSYIFLNKTRFEANAIPQEVLLHEQTHAKQKHSLDILFIELLQVVFWFNPLLYFIKKDIKLNHEFLADEAVLKQGIDSSAYQETLLLFTSSANGIPLAHAINYSLIKKRFTIMKTQTSKKAVWLRSLLLLPFLGGLLFSFSSRKEVEKDVVPAMVFPEKTQNTDTLTNVKEELVKTNSLRINYTDPTLDIKQNPLTLRLNGKITTLENLEKDFKAIIRENKSDLKINAQSGIGMSIIYDIQLKLKKYLGKIRLAENVHLIGIEEENSIKNNIIYNPNSSNSKTSIPMIGASICDNCTLTVNKTFAKQARLTTNKNEKVTSFKVKFFNKSTLSINGDKFNESAIEYLKQLNDEEVLIFDIKTSEGDIKSTIGLRFKEESTQNPILTINGIVCDRCELNLSKKGVEKMTLSTTTGENILSFKVKFPRKSTLSITGNGLNEEAIHSLNTIKLGTVIQLFDIKTASKNKLAPVTIRLVDENAKNYSKSPVVIKEEKSSLPPPPPPPAPIKKYKKMEGKYNKMKSKANETLPPPPPPPPAPKSLIDQVVLMAKKGATFYYNAEQISSDKAIEIVKNNSKINLSMHANNGKSTVHLSNKPTYVVNGRAVISEKNKELIKKRKKLVKARDKKNRELIAQRNEMVKVRGEVMERRRAIADKKMKEVKERKSMHRPLAEQFKGMEVKGTTFYYEGDKISETKAITLIKANPKLNVSMHNSNGVGTVHLSKKGIKTVNGKLVKKEN